MPAVHHRYATVQGRKLFYREAGSPDAPAFVLLHGFPTSSFMFRELTPRLADRYHVIAPDHLGFGFSDAPSTDEFDYTFDALTDLTAGLLAQLGIDRYAIYVQDYGAPIGWRLALRDPEAITTIVSQNGNGYEEGFVDEFWDGVKAYQRDPSPENEAPLRAALSVDAIKWQYVTGVSDETLISPDTWTHDAALVGRPDSRVPVLAVWGQNDPIFGPDGARAFAHDTEAEVHLLDGGHFLLESAGDEVAALIRDFLGRKLDAATG